MIQKTIISSISRAVIIRGRHSFPNALIAGIFLAGSPISGQDEGKLLTVNSRGTQRVDVAMSSDEYKNKLSEESYEVCWRKGTEPPFSGKYYDHFDNGTYVCICCRTPLFSSESKYQSACGWPSFSLCLNDESGQSTIRREKDTSLTRVRTEVLCKKCGSHLGHVFPDGPPPTGERYCINSLSIDFVSD